MALALAGLGLLTGAAQADVPSKLHDEVRHRVIDEVGVEEISADAVRTALGRDPDFGLLLEYYQERTINGFRSANHAEDAVQETLLKIWKGQPQLFLKPLDEVLRYFQTSIKHNFITQITKETNHRERWESKAGEVAEFSQASFRDPAEEAASKDLFDELASRLSRSDLDVLEAYLSSPSSQRKIAQEIGISRYAASRSTERVKEVLRNLLQDVRDPDPHFSLAK
jgi:RNA polymerase sigma factor (sigma-70 family)